MCKWGNTMINIYKQANNLVNENALSRLVNFFEPDIL